MKIFDELYFDTERLQRANTFRKMSGDIHGIMMTMAAYAKTHITKQQPTAKVLTTPYADKPNGPKPV